MKIERKWALASKRTFKIKPISKLIREEIGSGVVIEPFPFESKIDVFDYLAKIPDSSADYALVDPPYSKRQVAEHYKKNGVKASSWQTSAGWTAKVKRETAKKLKPGGKSITFGWNSSGLGKGNGCKIERILLVCHGSDHYDTLCIVEKKVQKRLFDTS
jgi:hypothetical protein